MIGSPIFGGMLLRGNERNCSMPSLLPRLSGGGGTTIYDHEYEGAIVVANLNLAGGGEMLVGATMRISSGAQTGDRIIRSQAEGESWTRNGIDWSWISATKTLTGVGAALRAEYISQLNEMRFDVNLTSSGLYVVGARTVVVQVDDGANESNEVAQSVSVGYYTGLVGQWNWIGGNPALNPMSAGEMGWDAAFSAIEGVPIFNAVDRDGVNRSRRLVAIQFGALPEFADGVVTATTGFVLSVQKEANFWSVWHNNTGNGAWSDLSGIVAFTA